MLQPEDIDKEALQDQIDLVEESENQRAQAEQIICLLYTSDAADE